MKHTIGVAELKVSNCLTDELVTYSLGSCIGLTVYDPAARVGGMVHCMLPLSRLDARKAADNPCMFVDTGVALLLQEVYKLGGQRARLQVKVAGGGNMMDPQRHFNIGERNYTVLRKILWKNNIMISAEDVGGAQPRTLHLFLNDGRACVRSGSTVNDL